MQTYFTYDLNPAIGQFFGLTIYWYGAVYTIGFLGLLGWLCFRRSNLSWSKRDVVEFCIFAAIGVLVGGRAFDIFVYEFNYYKQHPLYALNWWKGGLASHGVLIGGSLAIVLFCLARDKPFLKLADEIVVPAAFLFAVGRIGNFIEGGVIGVQASIPWGVLYPDVLGPRHPVALYESAKNFLIVFILIGVLRRYPAGTGIAMSCFIFLYAFLRFLVDLFRDYEATWLGLDKGQIFNLIMSAIGLALLVYFIRNPQIEKPDNSLRNASDAPVGLTRAIVLSLLILYPLGIPTSWTLENIKQKRQDATLETLPD